MRKINQEITDQKIIEQILSSSKICRLAMIDGNSPYLLPFNYGYKEGAIDIHTAPEGKKLKIPKENNLVCFQIKLAKRFGVSGLLVKKLYRTIIDHFINAELKEWKNN